MPNTKWEGAEIPTINNFFKFESRNLQLRRQFRKLASLISEYNKCSSFSALFGFTERNNDRKRNFYPSTCLYGQDISRSIY